MTTRILIIWWVIFSGVLTETNVSRASHAVEIGLAEPILIIDAQPVRIKLPGTQEYLSVLMSRSLPPGTIIDPENTASFRVLCPDWSLQQVADGAAFQCPDVKILTQVSPPLVPYPPPPTKVPDEEVKYKSILSQLDHRTVMEDNLLLKRLLCHLYQKAQEYEQADTCYRQAIELASQHDDIVAETFASLQLVFVLWARNQEDEAKDQIQQIFDVSRREKIPEILHSQTRSDYAELLQGIQEEDDLERQLMAHYQLALIARMLGENTLCEQHVEQALNLAEQIEFPLMGQRQMNTLILDPLRELLP